MDGLHDAACPSINSSQLMQLAFSQTYEVGNDKTRPPMLTVALAVHNNSQHIQASSTCVTLPSTELFAEMFAKTSKTLRARACCNSFMAAVLLVLDVVLVLVLAVVVALVLVVAAVLTLAVVALLVELVVYEEVEVKVVDVLVITDRLVSGVLVVLLVDVVVWRFLDL